MKPRQEWTQGASASLGRGTAGSTPVALIRRMAIGFLSGLSLLLSPACDSDPSVTSDFQDRTLVVLYTSDEHGWIEEGPETDGPAKLMGLWRGRENYDETGDFLVLSGGDNWTGPAISTWFEGESTVEVMNSMNYTASAIGNHEFDFTLDALKARIAQADFPYLAANIKLKGSNTNADFATPFVIEDVHGIRVGLVGLASTSTPWTTFPTHVKDYDFTPYAEALQEVVPQAWGAGADLVIVIGHICYNDMVALLPEAKSLGVSVLAGGHCHQALAEVQDGVALVIGGSRFASYGRVEIGFDNEAGVVTYVQSLNRSNTGGSPDPSVQAVVRSWQEAAAGELSHVVGHLTKGISQGSAALHNLVTDSWLFVDPTADIAMTNSGGIRQGLGAGEITLGSVIGVLPFQNNLVSLELTGSEVLACLKSGTLLGGMTTVGGYFHSDGTSLKMDSTYHVLTTDYLYARTDYNFHLYDGTPYITGFNYHQPTAAYIESLGTSAGDPLDRHLDRTPRR